MIEEKKEKYRRADNQVKISIALSKDTLERLEKRAVRKYNHFLSRESMLKNKILKAEAGTHEYLKLIGQRTLAKSKVMFWEDRLKQIHHSLTELIILQSDTDSI